MARPKKPKPAAPAELEAVGVSIGPMVTAMKAVNSNLPDSRALAHKAGYEAYVEQSAVVVRDALAFREIGPEDDCPPAEWVQALGLVEAERKFRIARAAWEPASKAPLGISMAAAVVKADMTARAQQPGDGKPLAIAVQIVMPSGLYPEREIER